MSASFAAIFDWDGVIIDSSAFHRKSWDVLAAETGKTLPAGHFERSFGKKNEVIIPEILGWTHDPAEVKKFAGRKEEIYREFLAKEGIAPMAGVVDLLRQLKEAKLPCGVGSSTPRQNIDLVMKLTNLDDYFQTIVSAEDVIHGKPSPDVFLQVARRLDADPAYCVVFEDAFIGIEAAQNAGMKSVGVASTNPLEKLRHADIAVKTLAEISISRLEALF